VDLQGGRKSTTNPAGHRPPQVLLTDRRKLFCIIRSASRP
jgi:hypothetical protein